MAACIRPFVHSKGQFNCQRCMACRVRKRQQVTARLCLEAMTHGDNAFVTLTYSDEHYPGELVPKHMRLFIKALRKRLGKVRYYGVGEYGDKGGRAHYHLFLFGVSIFHADLMQQLWKYGGIHVGEVTPHSAAYMTGYISKRMTAFGDERLDGRHPEFCRMSRRPGIGSTAAELAIASMFLTKDGSQVLATRREVPSQIRIDGKVYSLDSYMRKLVRKAVGWEPGMPRDERLRIEAEWLAMTKEEKATAMVRAEHQYESLTRRLAISKSKKRF